MQRSSPLLLLFLASVIVFAQAQSSNPAGSFIENKGARLYYQECGAGPNALILMHDGVTNSAVFDDVWPLFCKRFHTIRYDRRGYGKSPETTAPYYEADDLAALLTAKNVRGAALVASSHGGQVAMEFAMRYPERVTHLVVVGPGASGFPYSEQFLMRDFNNQQAKGADAQRDALVKDPYLIVPGHDVARNKLRAILTASPQDMTHNDMPLPERPVFPYAREIRVPTLILIGSGDIADNHAVAGALTFTIPNAQRIVIPDAGHLPYIEKPQEFFEDVGRFLTLQGFANTAGQ